jgi:hypothetical protein
MCSHKVEVLERPEPNKTMKPPYFILFMLCAVFTACDSTYYKNPQSELVYYSGQLGGKKQIASVTLPDGFAITGYSVDMEKSFRDGALTAVLVAGSIANAVTTKASEETSQASIAADAKVKTAAEEAALKKSLAAEETRRLGMELEAAAPVVTPTP